MSLPEDPTPDAGLPAPLTPEAPARPKRARWRKWLLYGLASLGALVIVGIVVLFAVAAHDLHTTAATLSRDDVVEESMTRNYGKYSDDDKGWLYVDPQSKKTYVMQVIQRAKVDVPNVRLKGSTAVYFAASGSPLGANGDRGSLLGLFVIQPDQKSDSGGLTETSVPLLAIDGHVPVGAQDVRFEALSKSAWGWVVKITRDDEPQPGSVRVDNVVYAPHGDQVVPLAMFPASGSYTEAAGCVTEQAARAAAASGHAASAAPEASAASGAASREDEEEDDGTLTPNCLDASWTYRTGTLPDDGFVPISVTGGGLVDGEQVPVQTFKLVFDPKSFTYVVPKDLLKL